MREGITLACPECKRRNYRTNKNKEDSFLFYVGAIIRVIPVDVRGINKLLFEEEV